MDPNARHGRGRAREADAYWQRRFFTLVAGLGVIGLLVWACSGVVGGKPDSHAAGSDQAAAYGSAAAGQSAGTAGMPSRSASAQPTAPVSASPTAVPASPTTKSASASRSAGQRPPAKAGTGGACPAADIVLTLLANRASYRPHDVPAFQIDIVSTGTATCAVDTGPEALRVVVMHGSQVAWNSGACQHGASSHVISLRRGVPVVMSIAWNRRLTVTGCPTTIMAAANRSYTAVAQAAGAQSPGQSFELTGSAMAAKPRTASKPK